MFAAPSCNAAVTPEAMIVLFFLQWEWVIGGMGCVGDNRLTMINFQKKLQTIYIITFNMLQFSYIYIKI